MTGEEGFFSASDGTKLLYRAWHQNSGHACLIIHGYGDHSERYADLVNKLSDLPCSFYAFDLRGQGRSGGERVYAKTTDDYVSDCYEFLDFLEKSGKLAAKRLMILGHSLGGLIALKAVLKNQTRWKALILSSPCFQLYGISWSPVAKWSTQALSRIAPHLVMSNLVKPRYLFHNADSMKAYWQDPLIERRVTAHLACAIINACENIQRENIRLDIPVLVLASGDDRIVELSATKRVFEKLNAPSKSIVIYPDLYHEIFNEERNEQAIRDLKQFMQTQIGENPS